MPAKRQTLTMAGGTWYLVTDPVSGAAAVTLQVRGERPIYLQGGASTTLPVNHPINAPDAEFMYPPKTGDLLLELSSLFPDIAAVHLFAWSEGPNLLTVRHAA